MMNEFISTADIGYRARRPLLLAGLSFSALLTMTARLIRVPVMFRLRRATMMTGRLIRGRATCNRLSTD
jgi:hypothetical protein